MKPQKIILVIGTRPEAIKLFPIFEELKKYPRQFKPIVIATGQHKELSRQIFDLFDFEPDFDFDIMAPNQGLNNITIDCLRDLFPCFLRIKPDMVLVQGDTTSALTGALAGYYAKVKVAHIEAGLRTHYKFNPYPEEMNRVLISQLAGYHFAPTITAEENLLKENISKDVIFITGNTVIDAAKLTLERYVTDDSIPGITEYDLKNRHLILVTAHRRESFGQPFENIKLALQKIAEASNKFLIVFPVHLNPIVQEAFGGLNDLAKEKGLQNIKAISPLSYPHMLSCMKQSFLILTDSGGLVEEASFLGKPVLILREVNDRPESVTAQMAEVVGTQTGNIYNVFMRIACACKRDEYKAMAIPRSLYGDGTAAKKIVEKLKELCE